MKTIKNDEHALLLRTFGLKNQCYLAVTAMILFDLNHPERPLKERDLWQIIPKELGKKEILDQGLPKPHGEVLVTGKCRTPQRCPRPAAQVSVRVGDLTKALDVFGHRFWKKKAGIMDVISDPEPFTEMPIVYRNTFGGPGYDLNPTGKGIQPVDTPEGGAAIPLPNIEDPGNLIGGIEDRPQPAGFGPLDMTWPQRAQKLGTYDEKWLKERWPHFPDDMKYEFFNAAPQDQFLGGYFRGDESIAIRNMHPDLPVIESRLPGLRIRCFVTTFPDLKTRDERALQFNEHKTYIDTVWLFPSILRGIVFYRATAAILDDEYADVHRIFLATEQKTEPARPIEYYLEEQQKRLPTEVKLDKGPFQEAQKKLVEGMRRIRRIPKQMEASRLKAMGKAPKMPPASPAEANKQRKSLIEKHMTRLDETEAGIRNLREKHGDRLPIGTDFIQDLREKFTGLSAKMDLLQTRMEAVHEQTGQVPDKSKAAFKAFEPHIPKAAMQKAGFDPAQLEPVPPKSENPWHDQGFAFVVSRRKKLERNADVLKILDELGLVKETIENAWLGFNDRTLSLDAAGWGLKTEPGPDGKPEPLEIPAGLVIPAFQEAELVRIRLRPDDFTQSGRDIPVRGSDRAALPLFAPSHILKAPVVIVPDELEAWLVEQEIGDAVTALALADPGQPLSDAAAQAIESASAILVVRPHSAAGDAESWKPWSQAFDRAMELLLPKGENVFEARKEGLDLRSWILDALPEEFARDHRITPPVVPGEEKPLISVIPPKFDVQALTRAHKKAIDDHLQGKMYSREDAISKAKAHLTQAGLDPEKHLPSLPAEKPSETTGLSERVSKSFEQTRKHLDRLPGVAPDTHQKLDKAEAEFLPVAKKLDGIQAGMPKAEAARQKAAEMKEKGVFSDAAKEKFKSAGIDLDKRVKLTREQVLDRYRRGESLSQAILSGVDLSGLDLHGADLSYTKCDRTLFNGANLEGANLRRINGKKADFSGASLKEANLEKGIFSEAKFSGADLSRAALRQTMFKKADLTQADFSEADIYMTSMSKVTMSRTVFVKAKLKLTSLQSVKAAGVDFTQADLKQCAFTKCNLDGADFTRAGIRSSLMSNVQGRGMKFTGSRLEKFLLTSNTALPGSDFSKAELLHINFRDADLAKADFRGARIEESILENCNLTDAVFFLTRAPRTRFYRSNLEGADMKGVNLFQGSLKKARLVKTDLRASNLFGVDFYKSVLGDTRFEEANLKMSLLHGRTDLLP